MRLKAAKMDAQTLANYLSSDWLIVRTAIKGQYAVKEKGSQDPEDVIVLTVKPKYEGQGPVRIRKRNYKARRRTAVKNEIMRKSSI